MAVPTSEVRSRAASLVQDIPLARVQELKPNPRRRFDETPLAELPLPLSFLTRLGPRFRDSHRNTCDKAHDFRFPRIRESPYLDG